MKYQKKYKKFSPKYVSAILVSLLLIFFVAPSYVTAQESMSGGSYTMNGGITVFIGQGTGGSFTLNPSGDPITGSLSGGGYTLAPTPYSSDSSSGSSEDSSSGGSGGQSGAGYTSMISSSGTSSSSEATESGDFFDTYYGNYENGPTTNTIGKGRTGLPVFVPKSDLPGVEWIDTGLGVDSNFDGIADGYNDIIRKASSTLWSVGGTEAGGKDADRGGQVGSFIKIYTSTISIEHLAILLFFLLLYLILPIIRGKNPRLVSLSLGSIFIEYIVALHKGQNLSEINIQNHKRNVGGSAEGYYGKIRWLDLIIIPAFFIFEIAYFLTISWAVTAVFIFLLFTRLYIGKNMGKKLLTR